MLVELANRYNSQGNTFHICNQDIQITPTEVKLIMDLPIEGNDVNVRLAAPIDESSVKIHHTLFNSYKTDHNITISGLERLITRSALPDDDFKRQFVLYAIGTILAPTTKDNVDAKYLALVYDVSDIARFNWGQFTLSNLLFRIHNFNIKESVNLQGNLPLLQIWYWEHVRPYAHHGVSYSAIHPPLMARWGDREAALRDAVFEKDRLDGGEEIKSLSQISTPSTANTANIQVIDAFAHISTVETDSKSVLTTHQTRKLLGEAGGIPQSSPLLKQIANKCFKRDMKEEYLAKNPQENETSAVNSDDVKEIANPNVGKQPMKMGSAKRKRGRPRRLQKATDNVKQEPTNETIAKRVMTLKGRATKPGPQKRSPYKNS
ncbi:hypothetical protein HU200_027601 [Digitaria exilis]|uniref:Aminotransferase-like plant mobile domain-containing protein n=1 Tax=Digitaria exilis TaxID=1010633 RepID=A0A835BUH0_9POAL|nr:hypothetical protein HU200_027601 [Digitaria exilis]